MKSPPTAKQDEYNINVDGEDFDITNLLGSLPDEGTPIDKPVSTPTRSPRPTAARPSLQNSFKPYPSVRRLLESSSHHLRSSILRNFMGSSFLGIGGHDSTSSTFSTNNNNDSNSNSKPSLRHQQCPSSRTMSRRSMASSMSSLTCSYHDIPGLTELNESISSFSESHYWNEDAGEQAQQQQEIEISPGVVLPFRASDETWDAIKAGQYAVIHCLDCSLELVAAKDCEYAICPECHTVNPMMALEPDNNNKYNDMKEKRHGVLMGFKKEWCGDYFHPVVIQEEEEEEEAGTCSDEEDDAKPCSKEVQEREKGEPFQYKHNTF